MNWLLKTVMSVGILTTMAFSTGCSNAVSKANASAPKGTGFVVSNLPTNQRKYGVFVPYNYDPNKAYPTILFLHGGFENGSNPETAFNVGLGPEIADHAKEFGYIVIFPQARDSWRSGDVELNDAYAALQETRRHYRVDDSRVILTGLSWGGYGVWALAEKHPTDFAALVPMCGNDKLDAVPAIKGIPIWAFHNTMDPFISCGDSRVMVDAVNKAGGQAKLTTYTALGHDVWVRAYRDLDLWKWMGQQHRAAAAPVALSN